jgi:hypothetical protein
MSAFEKPIQNAGVKNVVFDPNLPLSSNTSRGRLWVPEESDKLYHVCFSPDNQVKRRPRLTNFSWSKRQSFCHSRLAMKSALEAAYSWSRLRSSLALCWALRAELGGLFDIAHAGVSFFDFLSCEKYSGAKTCLVMKAQLPDCCLGLSCTALN